jgi:hypothetical protein
MGPCTTPSYSGSLYMLVLVNDYTRFTWVYFMKAKSEVFSRFKEFKSTMESVLNKKIKRFRTDNEGEFTSINFTIFVRSTTFEGSFHVHIHRNKMVWWKGRSDTWWRLAIVGFILAKNLPKALWAEGMACAAYVINRVPLSLINMKSPYELMF